jgi:dCTP diphosphatase
LFQLRAASISTIGSDQQAEGGDMSKEIEELQSALRQFASDRDWGQFHSPKNLAIALSVECAELLEHFQWLSEEQSRSLPAERVALASEELADVFLYLLQLSDRLGVDLVGAARRKMQVNEAKYPVELSKGRSNKYTEL